MDNERICKVCGLPFNHTSLSGYYICPHCDRGVYRDKTKWTYKETLNAKMRKEKAKQIYHERMKILSQEVK